MKLKIVIVMFTLLLATATFADIQIVIKDPDGKTSTISSNGKFARMDASDDNAYIIIDLNKKTFISVNTVRKEIFALNNPHIKANQQQNGVNIELQELGKGPVIAGYKTQKYLLKANGQTCQTIFGSRQVMQLNGISEIFTTLSSFAQQTSNMMGGFSQMLDNCTQADLAASKTYLKTGAPLRLLDNNGQLESEVKSINTSVIIDPGFYQIPAGYNQKDMQQQMQQSQQAIQQMQQQMPAMNKMFQQIQQQGDMPPEIMEQMKNLFNQEVER